MLKGQSHTDINLTGGTVIFFVVSVAIFTALIAPIIFQYFMIGSTENDVKAVEFSNLARTMLLDSFGDGSGNILYSLLHAGVPDGMESIGLADNYLHVENIYTKEYIKIGENGGRFDHDTFSSIKTFHNDVGRRKEVVMTAGREYMVHSYRLNSTGSVAVDIYTDFMCSEDGDLEGYMIVECERTDNIPVTKGIDELVSTVIAPVVNGILDSGTARMTAGRDITASDLLVSGTRFGSTQECLEKDGIMCFRTVGNFNFPARIHTEIGKDSSMETSNADEEGEIK